MFHNIVQCYGSVIYTGYEIDFQIVPDQAPNRSLRQDFKKYGKNQLIIDHFQYKKPEPVPGPKNTPDP